MPIVEEGDRVEVRKSNSGYKGPGTVVCRAYGSHFLVRTDEDPPRTVLVNLASMVHAHSKPKPKGRVKDQDE